MDDYLWDMTAMEEMMLNAFQNDQLGDDVHITYTLFESLKFTSTTPLYGPHGNSKYTPMPQGEPLLLVGIHNLDMVSI